MRSRLSKRQQLTCIAIVAVMFVFYFGFCLRAVGRAWLRKEGDVASTAPWVQNVSLFLVFFPFGYIPGLRNILMASVLNGLLWSTLAGLLYIRYARRKTA